MLVSEEEQADVCSLMTNGVNREIAAMNHTFYCVQAELTEY